MTITRSRKDRRALAASIKSYMAEESSSFELLAHHCDVTAETVRGWAAAKHWPHARQRRALADLGVHFDPETEKAR